MEEEVAARNEGIVAVTSEVELPDNIHASRTCSATRRCRSILASEQNVSSFSSLLLNKEYETYRAVSLSGMPHFLPRVCVLLHMGACASRPPFVVVADADHRSVLRLSLIHI